MTKELLEQYPDICAEIERLGRPVKDTVSGSSPEFPYTQHPIEIKGIGIDRAARKRVLLDRKREIEAFASSLDNSKERLLVEAMMEFGSPIPWSQIIAKLGHRWNVDKARYRYKKICEKYF